MKALTYLAIVSHPVHVVSHHIAKGCKTHPKVTRHSVAVSVILSGSYMATHPIEALPHFLWDAIAYFVHGVGAAPIIEAVIHANKRKSQNESSQA